MSIVEVQAKGSKIELPVGAEVVLRLSENATTGYQWTLTEVPAALTVVGDELTVGRDAAPGAAGERAFTFRAVEPGEGGVRARLARSWEQDKPPQDEFDFFVHVR
jgi:predicted secreted protein